MVYIDDVLIGTMELSTSNIISCLEIDSYTMLPECKSKCLKHFDFSEERIVVELFASDTNATHRYYMTKQNSAFYYNWSDLSYYLGWMWAHPPFHLLSKVLTKIVMEPCRLFLVVPKWETSSWFSLLRSICLQYILC